jgi:hypothetical protein
VVETDRAAEALALALLVIEVSDELVVWLETAADDEVERLVEEGLAELSTLVDDTAAELVFELSTDEAEAEADDDPTEFVDEGEAELELSSGEVRLVEDAAAELEEAGWLDELDIGAELETVELEIAAELAIEELDTAAELVEDGKAEFVEEELEIAAVLELEEVDATSLLLEDWAAELAMEELEVAALLLEDGAAELELEELQGTVVHTTTGLNAAVTYDVTAMPPLIVSVVVEIVCEG